MSKDKPKKRLVGNYQFIETLLKKCGLYSLGLTFWGMGVLCVLVTAILYVWAVDALFDRQAWGDAIGLLVGSIAFSMFSFGTLRDGANRLKSAVHMEPVTLITRHNTGQLPEVETLVRSSDRPSSAEQAELVRAAGQRVETPPEELLRAAHESVQNV